jgi:hypothetical protein
MSTPMALAGRGHTNLLTGGVRLLDVPAVYLNRYIVRGRLPRSFLSSFLHESTHFWCTSSPLGLALAMLEMRAQRSVILNQIDRQQLFRDMVVSQAAHLMLTPLLEGMALFTEFDSFPGRSEVLSAPTLWASQLFAPLETNHPTNVSAEWISHQIVSTVIDYRSSQEANDRKTAVLMQSFDRDEHFYLAGYLTVKVLFGIQATRSSGFQDRDLFLHFLRDWVFRDWVLIDYILNDELSASTTCHLMSERMQQRLDILLRTDLSLDSATFEKDIAEGHYGENTRALRIQEHEARSGINRHNNFASRFINPPDNDLDKKSAEAGMVKADLLTLQHRQKMLRLATEKVEIEVNEYDRVFVRKPGSPRESFYLNGPALPGVTRGTTQGWLAVYYLPDYRAIGTIALRDNQAVLWFLNGAAFDKHDDAADLRFAATKTVATEDERCRLTILCREIAKGYDHDENPLSSGWIEHIRMIYERTALAISVPAKRSKLPGLLRRKGIYDLFEKNGDLLATFVAMSLFPLIDDVARSLLTSSLGRDGINFASCFEKLTKVQDRTGMQLFIVSEDGDVLCTA